MLVALCSHSRLGRAKAVSLCPRPRPGRYPKRGGCCRTVLVLCRMRKATLESTTWPSLPGNSQSKKMHLNIVYIYHHISTWKLAKFCKMIWFLWRKICISISTARDWCQTFPRNWSDRLWTRFLWLFYCLKQGCVVLRKMFVYPLVSTRSVNGCKMVGVCRSTMIDVSCGCDEQVCSRTYYCRPTICIVHVYILVRIISYYMCIYILLFLLLLLLLLILLLLMCDIICSIPCIWTCTTQGF